MAIYKNNRTKEEIDALNASNEAIIPDSSVLNPIPGQFANGEDTRANLRTFQTALNSFINDFEKFVEVVLKEDDLQKFLIDIFKGFWNDFSPDWKTEFYNQLKTELVQDTTWLEKLAKNKTLLELLLPRIKELLIANTEFINKLNELLGQNTDLINLLATNNTLLEKLVSKIIPLLVTNTDLINGLVEVLKDNEKLYNAIKNALIHDNDFVEGINQQIDPNKLASYAKFTEWYDKTIQEHTVTLEYIEEI